MDQNWICLKIKKIKGSNIYNLKSKRTIMNVLLKVWKCHSFPISFFLWFYIFESCYFLTNLLKPSIVLKKKVYRWQRKYTTVAIPNDLYFGKQWCFKQYFHCSFKSLLISFKMQSEKISFNLVWTRETCYILGTNLTLFSLFLLFFIFLF